MSGKELIPCQMVKFAVQKGSFVKSCPCSPETVSCGYFNLNLHTGCPFSCSYCILQSYLESKELVFFSNIDDVYSELEILVKKRKHLRLGTGELSDSLAVDQKTNYSKKILSIFEKFPSVVFEFKTKSAKVKNIVDVSRVLKNIVISWSLNPEEIITVEEPGTPALAKRLQALNKVQSRGYKIGIHLDPIIFVKNWKGYYTRLIQNLAKVIKPEQIAWISLGSLRFPSSLREYILQHKNSRLFSGELIRGYDEKYRYIKSLRLDLFQYVVKKIRILISETIPLYLCMEDTETWEEIFPEIKPDTEKINKMLYLSVFGNK